LSQSWTAVLYFHQMSGSADPTYRPILFNIQIIILYLYMCVTTAQWATRVWHFYHNATFPKLTTQRIPITAAMGSKFRVATVKYKVHFTQNSDRNWPHYFLRSDAY